MRVRNLMLYMIGADKIGEQQTSGVIYRFVDNNNMKSTKIISGAKLKNMIMYNNKWCTDDRWEKNEKDKRQQNGEKHSRSREQNNHNNKEK